MGTRTILLCSGYTARRSFHLEFNKHTWKLKHVYMPSRTPEGQQQRKPSEHPDLMKYEAKMDREYLKPPAPIKVILLADVKGLGIQFDVLEVPALLARSNLIPGKKAVYATSFDLEYYARRKENMADELAKRVRVPEDLEILSKKLQNTTVPLLVSMHNKWTLNKEIVLASLLHHNIVVSGDRLQLEMDEFLEGPSFEKEGMIINFNLVIDERMTVKMTGRLTHVSPGKGSNLSPLRNN